MRPALDNPLLDILGEPHLALRQIRGRRREVGTAGDLVDALTADATEPHTDLMSAHEPNLLSHTHDYSDTTRCHASGVLVAEDGFDDGGLLLGAGAEVPGAGLDGGVAE